MVITKAFPCANDPEVPAFTLHTCMNRVVPLCDMFINSLCDPSPIRGPTCEKATFDFILAICGAFLGENGY